MKRYSTGLLRSGGSQIKISVGHPFHLVDIRPWPIIRASGTFLIFGGLAMGFHFNSWELLGLGGFLVILAIVQWWRDVIREASLQGYHTTAVAAGMRWGIILFIVSEVLFFFSFFWAFFHSRLAPVVELGRIWPPRGVVPLDPFSVPLLNTIILLSSGVSVTYAHHRILSGKGLQLDFSLAATVLLGIYFTEVQAEEYINAPFSLADSVYGRTFFVATGFHGLHVIVGTIFLYVCLFRARAGQFSAEHHFGFEAAAWYWHFVDVVWLFLFTFIYWWGR